MIYRALTWTLLLLTVGAAGCETGHTTGRAVSADGVEIHYETWGAGEPALVFVHGWSCDGSYWADQVEAFAADRKVVTVDLAGHGQSGDQRTDYTMAAFGADVVAVLEALDLEKAILVGHSMGGPVVVEAALAAPARVRELIGIDNFQDFNPEIPTEQVAAFQGAMKANFAGTVEPWVRSMFPAGADSALVEAIAKDIAAAPPAVGLSAIGHTLDWMAGAGTARLELLEVNLTTISSDMHETEVEQNREVVPGFEARIMTGVGHFPMRSRPEAFNALLAEAVAEYE